MLLQELRRTAVPPRMVDAQVETLRLRLLKIGGRVEASVRRIVIHLAASHPWAQDWVRAGRCLAALST